MVECEVGTDSRPVSALLLSINPCKSRSLSGPLFDNQHTIKGHPNFHVRVDMLQLNEIFIELLVYTNLFPVALKNMKEVEDTEPVST